jgi:nucleotide-binding universal stress UspA family protein
MNFLVGYNGTDEAKAALSLAIDFAKTFDAKIFVVTSMEGGKSEKPDEISQVETILDAAKLTLSNAGVESEAFQMARGLTPGEDLVEFAKENDIEHIFVGIEKKSRTHKLLLGSTAQFVILKAPCPVTTVK